MGSLVESIERAVAHLPEFVGLPVLARVGVQARQPSPVARSGVDARRESHILNAAIELGRVTADDPSF